MEDFELMLAPMEGHTGPELRELCYRNGADSTFTEMARTSGLARGNKSSLEKIRIPKDIPTHIQIIGLNERELEKFLQGFSPPQGFIGFNLNLGCPSPNLIRNGLGSASIKRISKVKKVVQIIRDHGYHVSIKLRLGMNRYEKEKKNYLNLIREVDADFFIVHARHGDEKNKDPADFSVYEDCVKTKKRIIANGDIETIDHIRKLRSIGVKGAMIGRAAVKDPSIFKRLKGDIN